MASKSKKFLKHIIQYNVLDYFIPRFRKLYKKLGILDLMDHTFYWTLWKLGRWALMRKFWKGKTTGLHHLPQTGAAIIVANHSHLLDPFFIGARIPRFMHWVSKIENYYHPFFRPILQCTGCIPLRRGESDKNALRLIRKELARGEIVGIFPEGTRTRSGYLNRFHTGAARMCLEFNIPYIPVGVSGSYKCKMGDQINVHFGRPVYPDPDMVPNYENAKIMTNQMKKDIIRLSGVKPAPKTLASYKQKAKTVSVPKKESFYTEIVKQQLKASRVFEM